MSFRNEKINREIMRGLSQIVHDELPLEHYGLITLTEVDVGPGYESAKVFFTTLKNEKETEKMLNSKAVWFRKMLGKKIIMRRIPQLHFVHDERSSHFQRIEKLIQEENEKNLEK